MMEYAEGGSLYNGEWTCLRVVGGVNQMSSVLFSRAFNAVL